MFATCLSVGDPTLTGVPRSSAPENWKVIVCQPNGVCNVSPNGFNVSAGSALCGCYSVSGQEFKANGSAMSN